MIVYLMRMAGFSAAHNYFLSGVSDEENRHRFGKWAAREPHGHNYQIQVTIAGEVDERTGMVVNITEINQILKDNVLDNLDGRFVNREVDFFVSNAPTVENIARYVWNSVEPSLPVGSSLRRVKIWEMETIWSELVKEPDNQMVTTLTRAYDFSASHRLHSHRLSNDENLLIFGKCNNPNGHGHNYGVEVTMLGEPDPATGMLFSLEELDRVVEEEVLNAFDHKHLNKDTPEFADTNPTSEMLSVVIWQKLAKRLPISGTPRLYRVVVKETARNSFEYRGE
jgi:6-pyruvoyltetrahydropterin/6-carboxytetrahydropterin synthase